MCVCVCAQRRLQVDVAAHSQGQVELGLYTCQPVSSSTAQVTRASLTRRFLGTGIVSVCAANATERSRSVDIAHQRPAWSKQEGQRGPARDLRRKSVSSWIISQDPAIELQARATGTESDWNRNRVVNGDERRKVRTPSYPPLTRFR